jgi:hypothetical protein
MSPLDLQRRTLFKGMGAGAVLHPTPGQQGFELTV